MSNSPSNQRLIAIATVVIIALLGVTGYLLYSKITQDKLLKEQKSELITIEKMQAELEKEYYQALSDLDELKSANEEMNALIDTQKEELKTQKDRIAVLLRSEKDLEIARAEIRKLSSMADDYVEEIKELKEENAKLAESNTVLSEEKRVLTEEVQKERQLTEELSTARAELVSQKENLESEKEVLERKVDVASVIRVDNVDVQGYKLRNNGKEAYRKRAKSVEGLKICFTTTENPIVPVGVERFYVRVVDPLGETLAIEDMGSGVMTLPESEHEKVRYTQYREFDYDSSGTDTDMCMSWQPGIPFNPGEYKVEIYNKGYLAGTGSFALK